jgi:hypothetical protein
MQESFSDDVLTDGIKTGGNFILAVCAGMMAAMIATLIWLGITAMVGHDVVYIVLGVGAFIGLAVRIGGHGSSILFGLLGAMMTLLSCFFVVVIAAVQTATTGQFDFYTIFTRVDLAQLMNTILTQTTPEMYAVYGIGLVEAFVLSIRKAKSG